MKKYITIMAIILTSVGFANEEYEGKVKFGFSASYGIEGLDFNINQGHIIKTLLPRKNIYNEEVPKNGSIFASKVNDVVNTFKPLFDNDQITIKPGVIQVGTGKKQNIMDFAKKTVKRGGLLDVTLFDGEIKAKKIYTTFGAKLYGTTTRIGETNNLHKVDKAVLYTKTDTDKVQVENDLYIKGYDKENVGLDKFRVEDNRSGKSNMQFESKGKIVPFDYIISPELAYNVTFAKDKKEILFAPGITFDIVKNANERLNVSGVYHFSNYNADKFSIEDLKKDIPKLAPGENKVEYFKNWELAEKRSIENGTLTGRKGSIRAVGLPTGTLYGKPILKYAFDKGYSAMLNELGEEISPKIKNLIEKDSITINDIKDLSQSDFNKLVEKFGKLNSIDALLEHFSPYIEESFEEIGLKDDEEVSSYYLTNMIPKEFRPFLKYTKIKFNTGTKQEVVDKNSKIEIPQFDIPLPVIIPNETKIKTEKKPTMSIIDDIEFAFPDDNLKDVHLLLDSKKLINSVKNIVTIKDNIIPQIEYFKEFGNNINSKEKTIDKIIYSFGEISNLTKNAMEIKKQVFSKKDDINNSLDEVIKVLENISKEEKNIEDQKDPKDVQEAINYFKERKKALQKLLDIVDNPGILATDGLTILKNKFEELGKKFELFKNNLQEKRAEREKLRTEDQLSIAENKRKRECKINPNGEACSAFTKQAEKAKKEYKRKIAEIDKKLKEIEEEKNKIENEKLQKQKEIEERISKYQAIVQSVKDFKDIENTYFKQANVILSKPLTKSIHKITDIMLKPETVENFDMFAGIHVLQTEYEHNKKEYTEKSMEKLKDIEHNSNKLAHGFNFNINYQNLKTNICANLNLDSSVYRDNEAKLDKISMLADFSYEPKYFELDAKFSLLNKNVGFDVKEYNVDYDKLSINTDVTTKLKLKTKNNKWIFRPGLRYVGDFEKISLNNGNVSATVYKRMDGKLIKKVDSPITNNKDFDNLKAGDPVDISKFSSYLFKGGYDKYFEKESVTKYKKWLKPVNVIMPTMDIVYRPIKNVDLEYNLIVPLKFVRNNFDGVMIKNSLGLTVEF
ncbi:hypothetical protein [Sneathia sanguinegens]|uniref:hypothetical protein n=1 Tax=Sneathia sanguinegens TaxID=40543 RepID=UPI0023F6F145|nr:hypothetical protein [Sneathia sanguinegens]MDU7496949.1 hypothetical protein [Sneathia sanguinegens]